MTIKLPEKAWFTFQELMERWQCTENDIRRLVIEQSLIPSFRTSEKLTTPDWDFEPSEESVPSCALGENSPEGYALAYPVLNHWLYLRLPLRISTFDCEFRLCSFDRDTQKPRTPDDVVGVGLFWNWIPEAMTMKNVICSAAFLLEEVSRFETIHTNQEQHEISEKPLLSKERNTLLTIIAALTKAAKINIDSPGKAAGFIEGLTAELGARVSKRAIEDHLKKIPDALETRMK